MCGGTPKPPPKSAEELAMEAEARAERENARAAARTALAKDKQARINEASARVKGLFGFRSLIMGSKGGSGFLPRMLGGAS